MTRFNTYLVLLSSAVALGGCAGPNHAKKKEAATLAIFLETSPRSGSHSKTISIFRDNPIDLTVETNPFLSEAFVVEAKAISVMDGFAISLKFDRRGTWMLEQYSAGNRGRRFAILVSFGKNLEQTRWLAAPLISSTISSGVLTFTPDATREETDEIVLGLSNVAKKVQADSF